MCAVANCATQQLTVRPPCCSRDSAMPPSRGVIGRCDACGGYKMGNGKGHCANSRGRPFICAGGSGRANLLCGTVKGGGRAVEPAAAGLPRLLRKSAGRATAIPISTRSTATKPRGWRQHFSKEMAAERRALEAAALRSGPLRNSLRALALGPAKQVRWRLAGPAPCNNSLTERQCPASGQDFFWWEAVGRTADAVVCGSRCALCATDLAPVLSSSRFARLEVLRAKRSEDSQPRRQTHSTVSRVWPSPAPYVIASRTVKG